MIKTKNTHYMNKIIHKYKKKFFKMTKNHTIQQINY